MPLSFLRLRALEFHRMIANLAETLSMGRSYCLDPGSQFVPAVEEERRSAVVRRCHCFASRTVDLQSRGELVEFVDLGVSAGDVMDEGEVLDLVVHPL